MIELGYVEFFTLVGLLIAFILLTNYYERRAKNAERKAKAARSDERWRFARYCRKREFGLNKQGDRKASREARTIANALELDDDMHRIEIVEATDTPHADEAEKWLKEQNDGC